MDGGREDEAFRAQINELYESCVVRRADMDGLLWCDVVPFLEGLDEMQVCCTQKSVVCAL